MGTENSTVTMYALRHKPTQIVMPLTQPSSGYRWDPYTVGAQNSFRLFQSADNARVYRSKWAAYADPLRSAMPRVSSQLEVVEVQVTITGDRVSELTEAAQLLDTYTAGLGEELGAVARITEMLVRRALGSRSSATDRQTDGH